MSAKHIKTPVKAAIIHKPDDLELEIRKGARRQRVFSIIVLALLVTAFVATSVMQALPLLFH